MKHLKTDDLVRLTGYSRASIARMARRLEIPGTCAPDGVHFAFEDGDELRQWIEQNKKRRLKIVEGRQTNKQATTSSKALNGGQIFYMQTLILAKSGDIKMARTLIDMMQKSIEVIREVCDGKSA
jgi:predicted DNA-binding transcriptional regulator AlpA